METNEAKSESGDMAKQDLEVIKANAAARKANKKARRAARNAEEEERLGRVGLTRKIAKRLLDTNLEREIQAKRIRSMKPENMVKFWNKLNAAVARGDGCPAVYIMREIVKDEARRLVTAPVIRALYDKGEVALAASKDGLRTSAIKSKAMKFATPTPSGSDFVPDAVRIRKQAGKICGGY
ncbi:hypothetical protein [Aeromonas caviae]|uniref:hypothetical protein n=1 Tax=Aeromonas caviae TaxID=648 RepID=UPI0038D1B0DF